MARTGEITIPFDERKIEAMQKFPIGAELSYEDEILAAVETIYRRRVPDNVRYLLGEEWTPQARKRRKATEPPKGAAEQEQ